MPAPPPDPAARMRAMQALEAACGKQDDAACVKVALALAQGRDIEADPVRAVKLFDEACARSYADACHEAALAYDDDSGVIVAHDAAKASTLHARACELGSPRACDHLAQRDKRPELEKRARELEISRCASGNDDACFDAGDSAPPQAWQRVVTNLEKKCEQRDGDACDSLGFLVLEGRAGKVDPARSQQLRLLGCSYGDYNGCNNAVERTKDPAAARKLWETGCDAGDARSCEKLASGIDDEGKRLKLYERGCELGDVGSCMIVRNSYEARNDEAALVAIRPRLCGMGRVLDCMELGVAAEKAGDVVTAHRMFARACMFGDVWRGCASEHRAGRAACKLDATLCPAVDARLATLSYFNREIVELACCSGDDFDRAPANSPTAAVFTFKKAVYREDAKHIATLIHPTRGLSIKSPKHTFVARKKVTAAQIKQLDEVLDLDEESVKCRPAQGTKATCIVGAVTVHTFGLERVGKRWVLVSLERSVD
jgi:TPR repeat protein